MQKKIWQDFSLPGLLAWVLEIGIMFKKYNIFLILSYEKPILSTNLKPHILPWNTVINPYWIIKYYFEISREILL